MSTTARKARKRARRFYLDIGRPERAEAYRFQHPRKAPPATRARFRSGDPVATPTRTSLWRRLLGLGGWPR